MHLTMSCRKRNRGALPPNTAWRNSPIYTQYLILFIQDKTEDLQAVSLLYAGPPSNHEGVVILSAVAVVRETLLV